MITDDDFTGIRTAHAGFRVEFGPAASSQTAAAGQGAVAAVLVAVLPAALPRAAFVDPHPSVPLTTPEEIHVHIRHAGDADGPDR